MTDAIEVWRGFWSMAAIISAILSGCLFVCMALIGNAGAPVLVDLARTSCRRALFAFSIVAVLGLIVQMPGLSPRRLGAAVALLGLIGILVASWSIMRAPKSRENGIASITWTGRAPWIGYLVLAWSGFRIVRGGVRYLDWLGVGGIILLVSAGAIGFAILSAFRRSPA